MNSRVQIETCHRNRRATRIFERRFQFFLHPELFVIEKFYFSRVNAVRNSTFFRWKKGGLPFSLSDYFFSVGHVKIALSNLTSVSPFFFMSDTNYEDVSCRMIFASISFLGDHLLSKHFMKTGARNALRTRSYSFLFVIEPFQLRGQLSLVR